MIIRLKSTGAVIQEGEFRSLFPNTSLPQQLTETIINDLGGDVVFEGPQASGGEFWQYSQQAGVEQIGGKWYTKYILGPVFTGTEEATAAEVQAAYIAQKTAERDLATQKSFTDALTAHLDSTAQERHYDDRITCAVRAGFNGPFQAEGHAFAVWMDTCNAFGYQYLEEVKAGTKPVPASSAEFIALLPQMVWPT